MLKRCTGCRCILAEVLDPLVKVDGESSQLTFPVSQHSPVLKSLKLLVIPIRAQDASGNACGGTKAITYTKEVNARLSRMQGVARGHQLSPLCRLWHLAAFVACKPACRSGGR